MRAGPIAGAMAAIAMMMFSAHAGAVVLAKLQSATPGLLLCPMPGCPAVSAPLPRSGGMVALLEESGGYARISAWMSRAEAAARFAGIDAASLPERVALWIDRRQVATGDATADAAALAAGEARKPEPPARQRSAIKPPVQQRAPRKLAAANPSTGNERAPGEAKIPAAVPPLPEAAARIAAVPPALPRQPAPAADPANAPAPDRLTPELMDRRLRILPSRPIADYTMKQIVALRREALAYIEIGACTGIKDGGKTTTPGFLYIVCDGDEAWRQFAE